MTEERKEEHQAEEPTATVAETDYKIHIARVPTKFTEDIVRRILQDQLKDLGLVKTVELIYPREDAEGEKDAKVGDNKNKEEDAAKEYRGFGFVSFSSQKAMDTILQLGTIKGGRKRTSTKHYTMHLRPYQDKMTLEGENGECAAPNDTNNLHDVCYLWSLNRCPYGDDCKFRHVGPGGCVGQNDDDGMDPKERQRKKKGKCFAFKKGKCDKGDECPFSHDFAPDVKKKKNDDHKSISKSEKDCINWKTKGKCRKGDKCEYRHDPEVQQRALAKKRKRQDGPQIDDTTNKKRKEKQPLAVRVFGMPYDCTQEDVRDLFKECGTIHKTVFPTFEDSGRSKGFCGVWFVSPKAAEKALELDGAQLHDRWIRIQRGKTMDVNEWEKLHHQQSSAAHVGRD